jgi:lipopolysaccharide heptosyltransferase II
VNNPPKKILLIRFSALGDVIQTLPILPMVRRSYPDAFIGWAIDKELVPVIEGHPDLNHIHACNRNQWTRSLSEVKQWGEVGKDMLAFVDEIKQLNYDVAIDLQGLLKTALVSYLTGIKRRIGFAHEREFSGLFYTEKYLTLKEYFDPKVLHVEHMRVLSRAIGCQDSDFSIEMPPTPPATEEKIAALIGQAFSSKTPIIACAPGTQWVSKAWPKEHWINLLGQIFEKTKFNVIMVGSKADAPLIAGILQNFSPEQMKGRVLDISGKTSVPEMYAVYRRVQLAVGSDSAPLHIAGAVKTPHVIGLYGPTGYRRTPPIGSPDVKLFSLEDELACQPCHKKDCPLGTTECLYRILPDQVFASVAGCLN